MGDNDDRDKDHPDKKKPNQGKTPKSMSNSDLERMCAGMQRLNSVLMPNSAEGLQQRRFNPDMSPAANPQLSALLFNLAPSDQENSDQDQQNLEDQPGPSRNNPEPPVENMHEDFNGGGGEESDGNGNQNEDIDDEAPMNPLPRLNLNELHVRIRDIITDLEAIEDQLESSRQERRVRESDLHALLIAADSLCQKELYGRKEQASTSPKLATPENGAKGNASQEEEESGSESDSSGETEVSAPPPLVVNDNQAPPENMDVSSTNQNQNTNRSGSQAQPPNGNPQPQGIAARIRIGIGNASSLIPIGTIGFSMPLPTDGLPFPAWAGQRLGIPPELYSIFQNYPIPTAPAISFMSPFGPPPRADPNGVNGMQPQPNSNSGGTPNPAPPFPFPTSIAVPVRPLLLNPLSSIPGRRYSSETPVVLPTPPERAPATVPERARQPEQDPNQQAQLQRPPAPAGRNGRKRSISPPSHLAIFITNCVKRRAISNSDDDARASGSGTGRGQPPQANEIDRRSRPVPEILARVQARPRAEALGRAADGGHAPEGYNAGPDQMEIGIYGDQWYGQYGWCPYANQPMNMGLGQRLGQELQRNLQLPQPMMDELGHWVLSRPFGNPNENAGGNAPDQRVPPAHEVRIVVPGEHHHHGPPEPRNAQGLCRCRCCMRICSCNQHNRPM